jgi:LacI family transcriptional regulator
MRAMPKVALLVETARGYGRALLRGVVRYARLHGPWGFYVTPGDFAQVLPQMQRWGGTGIIARIQTPRVARAILASGLPTVALDLSEDQLCPENPLSRLSEVASDSRGAARLAAEHLVDRGFRHYAFVGIAGRIWSQRRQYSFCQCIRRAGFEPHVYVPPRRLRDRLWENEQGFLAEWLQRLPRPIGVMACNDDRGRAVLEACRAAGIRVPEEMAVIGVDNDELLCEVGDPPLSSVALNAEAGGYRVAALLDRMMRGRPRTPARLKVEPLRVVTRRSTDIVALDDPVVAAALHYIHDHAGQPIDIGDVVDRLLVSRRALEIRFKTVTGRTLLSELRRIRLERARRLLLETDLSLSRVAAAAGYSSESYLAQVFHQELGQTPARYRRQAWAEAGP